MEQALIVDILLTYKYVAIFLGIMTLGEIVLIPSIYLAVTGYFDVPLMVMLVIVASSTGDFFWYTLGRVLHKDRLFSLPFLDRLWPKVKRFSGFFDKHKTRFLFLSKFVVGTRLVGELLAGMHHMPFVRYAIVNTAGVAAWTGLLFTFAYLIDASVSAISEAAFITQVGFGIFVVITGFLLWYLQRRLRQRWLRSNGNSRKGRTTETNEEISS